MQTLLIILYVYFVSFLDKPEKTAPQLSPRAVEQRAKWNIQTDEMDYPVSRLYLDSLRRMDVKIYHWSRWFNGATCEMTSSQAAKVAQLGFVTDVEMTRDNSAYIYAGRKRSRPYSAVSYQPLGCGHYVARSTRHSESVCAARPSGAESHPQSAGRYKDCAHYRP